jgi:serine/threonine protein kinase
MLLLDNWGLVGGIGAVYLAQHQLLRQEAAVKVHDYFPADQYVGAAFFRASNYLSQLDHANIVRLYDYGGPICQDSF